MKVNVSVTLWVCYVVFSCFQSVFGQKNDFKVSEKHFGFEKSSIESSELTPTITHHSGELLSSDDKYLKNDTKDLDTAAGHHHSHKAQHSSHGGGGGHGSKQAGHGHWGMNYENFHLFFKF